MNAAVDPDSPIGKAARAWALTVMGEDFPPERSSHFRAWLDADPLHRRAYEEAESVVLMLADLRQAPAMAAPGASPFRRSAGAWRVPVLAAAGLLAACMAVTVFARPPASYETSPGETRQIALADGSQIILAPASRLHAASRWRPRALSLDQGEAFFVVAKQDGRPFTVQAGGALVRVVGTRFNVHRGDRAVRVEVEQGVVEVSNAPNRQGVTVTLRAGQTALAGPRGVITGALPAGDQAGGWRHGRLTYDDVSLAEVVADLNRYGGRRLAVGSAAVGQMKVTTAFEIAQADRFLAELPRALPVRLSSDGRGGQIIVADAKRPPELHVP